MNDKMTTWSDSLPSPEFGAALAPKASMDALTLLATRRSASATTLTAPGPDPEALHVLLRLAVRVPDHGKLAPWRFILLAQTEKAALADKLDALAQARGDERARMKLAKLRAPPCGVAVVSSPKAGDIPEWEQQLSAGAVCMQMVNAASALGLGANWITDWYSYDAEALAILGIGAGERVAGFIFIGTPSESPLERHRPDVAVLTTQWAG